MKNEPKKKFKRCPGRGASLVSYHNLFLGEESLVEVVSTFGFHESYNRFAYSDIQSIMVRKTLTGKTLNIVFAAGLALALGGGIWFAVGPIANEGAFVLAGTASILLMILLGFGLYGGDTCTCHIRTAIQEIRLRSLGRLRNVNKTLALLRPRIEEAQGTLSPENIVQPVQPADSFTTPDQAPAPAPPTEPPVTDPASPPAPDQPPASPS